MLLVECSRTAGASRIVTTTTTRKVSGMAPTGTYCIVHVVGTLTLHLSSVKFCWKWHLLTVSALSTAIPVPLTDACVWCEGVLNALATLVGVHTALPGRHNPKQDSKVDALSGAAPAYSALHYTDDATHGVWHSCSLPRDMSGVGSRNPRRGDFLLLISGRSLTLGQPLSDRGTWGG